MRHADDGTIPHAQRHLYGVKTGLVLVILCDTILSRFGINFGFYSLNFCIIAQYLLVGLMIFTSVSRLDRHSVLLFALLTLFSSLSYLFNSDFASPTSLGLLLALYFPFIFTVSSNIDTKTLWIWMARAFGNITCFCAIAGIIQFFAQAVIHDKWLFNFIDYIPVEIRNTSIANTVIPFGSFIKSNGFFFLEPSNFSQAMAMALICEWWALGRRWWRLVTYILALILSYSGTGLLVLFIATLFPLGYKTTVRAGLILMATGIIYIFFGEALHLDLTFGRLDEFNNQGSSAHDRFIAPMWLLYDLFASDPWAPFIGHGPGMILRTVRNYEFHDPTWAKVIFEYGIVGGIAIFSFVINAVKRYPIPAAIKAVIFFAWLVGGEGLLTPTLTTLLYIFMGMWPAVEEGKKKPASLIAATAKAEA